jgi:hypothetical protein
MVRVSLSRRKDRLSDWKSQVELCLAREDHDELRSLATANAARVVRYLTGRLYSADPGEKWRAVRALGVLAADPGLLKDRKLAELLRRYFWALNDESGAVPYGIPEAIGEILAQRPVLQNDFLPVFCSLIQEEEVFQTGPVERSVIWGLGRIGVPVAFHSPETVRIVKQAAENHPDPETRRVAAWALDCFGRQAESFPAESAGAQE